MIFCNVCGSTGNLAILFQTVQVVTLTAVLLGNLRLISSATTSSQHMCNGVSRKGQEPLKVLSVRNRIFRHERPEIHAHLRGGLGRDPGQYDGPSRAQITLSRSPLCFRPACKSTSQSTTNDVRPPSRTSLKIPTRTRQCKSSLRIRSWIRCSDLGDWRAVKGRSRRLKIRSPKELPPVLSASQRSSELIDRG